MTRLRQTDSRFDGSALLPLWERLDEAERVMEESDAWFERTQVLTDRRLDSSERAGRRAYIQASALISNAREHQVLLERTFTVPGVGVFPHATVNLIRPAFEAAARALWIVDGHDSRERRLRGLRIAWEDHEESGKWAGELLKQQFMSQAQIEEQTSKHAHIGTRFRRDADALSIPWDRVKVKMNFRDEVGKFTALDRDPDLPQFLRAIWRRMSGVQHSMSYASLLGNNREHEVVIPGGMQVTLTTDDDSLLTDCRASALLQYWAIQKYIQRTTQLSVR